MTMSPAEFYERCNLKNNPFRSNPIHETDPRMNIWVGYDKERRQLERYITRTRADQVGNANFVMLYGDLGTGKTHALLWAQHQIVYKRAEEFHGAAYYIQTLKKQAGKVSFAGALKEDIVGKSTVLDDILDLRQFLRESIVDYKDRHQLGHDVRDEKILGKILPSVDLQNFARSVLKCETVDDVMRFLVPQRLTDYEAMMNFCRLVNLFVIDIERSGGMRRFRSGVYLFIDELDLLFDSPLKEQREANELFRHIYDNCPLCFCFILAFTATAAEINVLFEEYVLQRVNKQIKLEFLGITDAKTFVREIMDKTRAEDEDTQRVGYFPFTEDAIQAIVSQIVSITPRRIVNSMQEIIEECRLAGADPMDAIIDEEFLEEHEIIEEVLGME